ncbi:NADH-quinone oxidoreductase subunit A [Spongiactinospora sp. TRM90649]|uniref:NADH-quinone oxidoreductase subunit A n=1 Tax=Spongiactinospora sp. TRM90649 TaxID=3031114 RepID=UPI0023F7BEBE|nr:NADH-quinone oxidoreductase subunit A [Spongiactinospora sp. TRM90649]MDF5752203.1 NADH-quinone oxidoreductase subunit A [Spongiactinospora sp. TRM90649]
MEAAVAVIVVLALLGVGMAGVYAVAPGPGPLGVWPYLSGGRPAEQALSRYHVRYYAASLVFLAFEMEMVFMYPWALVVAEVGTTAVVEMFVFLGLLMAGVVYAWREGAFRWS